MAAHPMRRVALRNLAAHKVRLALTLLSVVLGTAFIAGSFVFTDTLQRTFDGIFADEARGVDVRISTEQRQSSGVPQAVADEVAAMDSVQTVAPGIEGSVVLLDPSGDKAVQTGGAPSTGQAYLPPERSVVQPDPFVAGAPPTEPDQIALNTGAAETAGLAVGDKTKILVSARSAPLEVTLSGIYAPTADTGGFIGVLFTEDQARQLFTDGTHVGHIDITAAAGVAPDTLRDQLSIRYPQYQVQNAEQVREEMKADISEALNFLNYFLLAFGAIALIVGTFIIYNTFSMLVAQRLRELALLRAVGASQGQVGRSVVGEALVIGVLGSVLGLLAGIALAYGLAAVLNAFDVGLPTGRMAVLPRTVLIAFVVGLVVTTGSAYAPARRAARIPPVQAMREEFATAPDSLRRRTIAGAILALAGVLLVVLGARNTGGGAAAVVGIGALGLVLAVLFASPALSRPVLAALGWLIRPFGPIGQMARSNAVRNPRRTAATAFALTLGLMLVTAIGMLGESAKVSISRLVDQGIEADYVLAGPQFMGVPNGAGDAVRDRVPEAGSVVGLRGVPLQVDGDQEFATAPDGPLHDVVDIDIRSGTDALGDTQVLVSAEEATAHGIGTGDEITVRTTDGAEIPLTVSGVYANARILGPMIVPPAIFDRAVPPPLRTEIAVLVQGEPGADLAALRTDLERATEEFVVVQVQDREQFKGENAAQINNLLAVLYGLLALAVVIAILGIVNTLALSVVERRREIGMLRAVGTQRSQVRRTIYLESMLIAVFGALVGAVLGLGLGIGFLRTLRDLGLDQIAVPWDQLVYMLIGSAVVGVLAALWPAVRAARTPPLAAIADI